MSFARLCITANVGRIFIFISASPPTSVGSLSARVQTDSLRWTAWAPGLVLPCGSGEFRSGNGESRRPADV